MGNGLRRWVVLPVACCILWAGSALAVSVVDVDLSDLNTVPHQVEDDDNNTLLVYESYGESTIVPYPSYGGQGIVNPTGGWFDKICSYESDDLDGPWFIAYAVFNHGPYVWSDYHFEFWDENFQNPLDMTGVLEAWDNDVFQNSSFDGYVLSFSAPLSVAPDEMHATFSLMNLDAAPTSFGIRQVATTVIPEPLSLLGVLLGIGAAARYARKRPG